MGTSVSVFSNEPNKFMYAGRQQNSYVQIEVDLNKFVPKLTLLWFSNRWSIDRPMDKASICQDILQKLVNKIQKTCDLSEHLTIEKVVYKREKLFYLQNGFTIVDENRSWCVVGISLRDVHDMSLL